MRIFIALLVYFSFQSVAFAAKPTTVTGTKACVENREYVNISADYYAHFKPGGVFVLNMMMSGRDHLSISQWKIDAPGKVRVHNRKFRELVLPDMVYILKDCNTLNSEWGGGKGKPTLVFKASPF